jgi:hypothetical protein
VGLTTSPLPVSQLPKQCGILNISQPYRPPLPVNKDNFTCTYHTTYCCHFGLAKFKICTSAVNELEKTTLTANIKSFVRITYSGLEPVTF